MKTTRRKLLGLLGLGAAAAAMGAGTAEAAGAAHFDGDDCPSTESMQVHPGTQTLPNAQNNEPLRGRVLTHADFNPYPAGHPYGETIITRTSDVVMPLTVVGTSTFTPMQPPVRSPGDTDVSMRCVACGWRTPWRNEVSAASVGADIDRMDAHMAQAHGSQQYTETVWRPHEEA